MPQPPPLGGRRTSRPSHIAAAADLDLWDEAVEGFLTRCRRLNLSAKTLSLYHHVLQGGPNRQRVGIFLAEHGITRVSQFTAGHLSRFEADLFEGGLSSSTVLTYHKTLRAFFSWAKDEAGLSPDPLIAKVRGPKLAQVQPATFSEKDIAKMLAGARTPRDRVLVEVFLRTGLRLEEMARLTIGDVVDAPAGAVLYVRGRESGGGAKGNKDRVVPLDTKVHKTSVTLRRYIEMERKGAAPTEPLFLARGGRPMSQDAIKSVVERLGERIGVHVNAHKFRHTFATRMLVGGANALNLQKALGHTSLTMVSRYVHYDQTTLTQSWAELEA